MEESFQCNYEQRTIASFVLLKLTSKELERDHEIRFYNVDRIDEFCMYGISNNQLETKPIYNKHCCGKKLMIPEKPRVLNKLLLTMNSEQNTERSDYHTFINFIKHLQQPVCLVANRGTDSYGYFPIIKHKLDKFKLEMPPNTLCLDSTFAFRGLDEQMRVGPAKVRIFNQVMIEFSVEPVQSEINADTHSNNNNNTNADNRQDTQLLMTVPTLAEQLDAETDWRAHNETTPQRPIVTGVKRRISNDSTPTTSEATLQKVRRRLFTNQLDVNKYDVTNMYERFFNISYRKKPYTESHVEALMHLIQVYGQSFTEYAKNYATPFAEIQ